MENNKKLTRSNNDRMIAGVCGGLGKHFELDPILFRIAFVLLAFMQGTGILLYIILALVIPAESEISPENRETGKEPPSGPSLAMSDMAHQVASITAPISAQVAKIEKTSGGGRYILWNFDRHGGSISAY